MKFAELKERLKTAAESRDFSTLKPCYAVYGDDAYLRGAAVKLFRALLAEEYSPFNYAVVDAADGVVSAVELLNTFPVFDDIRVVTLNGVTDKLPDTDKAALARYVSSPNPEAVLVVLCEEGGERLAALKGAEKADCNRPDETAAFDLAREIMAEKPAGTIDARAFGELYRRTLGSMAAIAGELRKLKAYGGGTVTYEDVCAMTAAEPDVQIYELSDAVSNKNRERSLEVLDTFIKDGVKPMTVLNLLYGHYRKMLHAELNKGGSDAELASLLGVKQGALYHIRRASGRYSQVKLKKCVDMLQGLQFDVLTGRRAEASALHEAVITLLDI